VPGGDVKQLLRGLGLIAPELMHQGSVAHFGPERRNDVSVIYLGEIMTLLGEPLDVIP
jgi:hypothetical protein